MSDVAVVVIGGGSEWARALDGEWPAEVVAVASLAEVRDAALSARAPLLWLLNSEAAPSGDALAVLVEDGSVPAVSLPVDDRGAPVDTALGRFVESDVGAVLDEARRRRVPMRHTSVVSLLVARDAVAGLDPPDPARFGRYAGSEWTARLFARHPGMLVARSRVTLRSAEPGSPLEALRMARSGVWGRGETLRELHRSVVRRGRRR